MAKKKATVSESEIADLLKTVTPKKEEAKISAPSGVAAVDKAFGVRRNLETRKYEIIEIHYNAETGEAKVHDIIRSETSAVVAQTRANEALARTMNGLKLDSMRRK